MSSAHYVIIARHDATGKLELPLGDLTLYGCEPEGEEQLLQNIRHQYGEDWSIAMYQPIGPFWSGKKPPVRYTLELQTRRAADGRQLTSVGITVDGQWIGYYNSFASAVTALTIRKVPVDEARQAIGPYWPNRKVK